MKKTLKTAIFAFAVVAAGLSGYKAYDAYSVKESTLMSENIEALSTGNGGDGAGQYDIWWNKLASLECEKTIINGSVGIFVEGVYVKPHASYTVKGSKKDCVFWPFTTCNPNDITLCQ